MMRSIVVVVILLALCPPALADDLPAPWSAWTGRLPIRLAGRHPATAGLLPVDVTFAIRSADVGEPRREFRLLRQVEQTWQEVPFQVHRLQGWTGDTDDKRSFATTSGVVTFFEVPPFDGDATYWLLYGNPAAEAPHYRTDLRVDGTGPAWRIHNQRMTVELHASGQIDSVARPGKAPLKLARSRGSMHWNPGVFIPTRYWTHAWDWRLAAGEDAAKAGPDPAAEAVPGKSPLPATLEVCEIDTGPVFIMVRREGSLPQFPEVRLSIVYRIFADRPYVESGTRIELLKGLGVVSLRNDQLVFDRGTFTHAGWLASTAADAGVTVRELANHPPINDHGDIFRLRPDAPMVAFFSPQLGVGAATVRIDQANLGPAGQPATLFDHATYLSNASLQYWFRSLVYFHVGWPRTELIAVPRGSIYAERNLYLFFEPAGDSPLMEPRRLAEAVQHRPDVVLGPHRLPPPE